MSSKQIVHTWKESKRKGDAGENAIQKYFSKWYVITPAVAMSEQRRGIDFTFASRRTSERLNVEVKSDYRSEDTGKFFVELESDTATHKAGWALTTQSDSLIFLMPISMRAYIVPTASLRARLPCWATVHKSKTARSQWGFSKGICVPVAEVAAISLHVCELSSGKMTTMVDSEAYPE